MKLDVVICGSGGQGVLTLARVITNAAVSEKFDAHFTAHSGIAQLDGPVAAHVRIGTPAGPSPKIPGGRADILVALDRLEAMRCANVVRPQGHVIIDEAGSPPPLVKSGKLKWPEKAEVEALLPDRKLRWIPATDMACDHGPPTLMGAVMLGAMAALTPTIERDHLVLSLRRERPKLADAEADAFFAGYSLVTGKDE